MQSKEEYIQEFARKGGHAKWQQLKSAGKEKEALKRMHIGRILKRQDPEAWLTRSKEDRQKAIDEYLTTSMGDDFIITK